MKYAHPAQENLFKCSQCSKAFSMKYHLTEHMLTHGDKFLKCTLCDYQSLVPTLLKKHNRTVHQRERAKLPCKVCGKIVAKSYLPIHLLSKHDVNPLGKEKLKCSVCSYECWEKHTLTDHLRTHSQERSFSCISCGMTFTQKRNMLAHEKKSCHLSHGKSKANVKWSWNG